MELTIIKLNKLMAKEVSSLVKETFDNYVAKDYTKEGVKTYHNYISPEAMLERSNNGALILVAIYNDSIAGMIEIINNNEISLFYVDSKWQKLGIGKELFIEAIRRVKNNHLDSLTVKASVFAEKVYSNLGFARTGEETVDNGMTVIPMIYRIGE
ncbi:MAG: GNAT family N-acetyltransferase [Spirochaetes bacterium]|nr:GNAT family N-acetyltransferase [Spirochaetota bacterium]MBN2769672.1 GNAT family N-acetyltransferase [Spirochaetota bacterium]